VVEAPPPDIGNRLELLRRYFSIWEIPRVEERTINAPHRAGKSPGPRNKEGYRSDSFHVRLAFNIAYLGCSWTEGMGLPRGKIFPDLVASELREISGISVATWNCGLASTGMDFAVRLTPSICNSLRPDLIVLVLPGADRREFFSEAGHRLNYVSGRPTVLANSGGFYDSTVNAFNVLTNDYDNTAHLLKSFRAFEAMVRSSGTPWVYSWTSNPQSDELMAQLIHEGYLPKDAYLGQPFARVDYVSESDRHPGHESHEVFAKAIVGWIIDRGFANIGDRAAQPGSGIPNSSSRHEHLEPHAMSRIWNRLFGRPDAHRVPRATQTKARAGDDFYPLW
jgi:hypothetical protein